MEGSNGFKKKCEKPSERRGLNKRGSVASVDRDTLLEKLLVYDLYDYVEKRIKKKSDEVWTVISKSLDNKISPLNIYMRFSQDRDNIQVEYQKKKMFPIPF